MTCTYSFQYFDCSLANLAMWRRAAAMPVCLRCATMFVMHTFFHQVQEMGWLSNVWLPLENSLPVRQRISCVAVILKYIKTLLVSMCIWHWAGHPDSSIAHNHLHNTPRSWCSSIYSWSYVWLSKYLFFLMGWAVNPNTSLLNPIPAFKILFCEKADENRFSY